MDEHGSVDGMVGPHVFERREHFFGHGVSPAKEVCIVHIHSIFVFLGFSRPSIFVLLQDILQNNQYRREMGTH